MGCEPFRGVYVAVAVCVAVHVNVIGPLAVAVN
jgi:hypothetical protein